MPSVSENDSLCDNRVQVKLRQLTVIAKNHVHFTLCVRMASEQTLSQMRGENGTIKLAQLCANRMVKPDPVQSLAQHPPHGDMECNKVQALGRRGRGRWWLLSRCNEPSHGALGEI